MLFAREAYNPKMPFVYASTGSVYGKVEDLCTEESPLNAVSLYGVNKRVAEEMVATQDIYFTFIKSTEGLEFKDSLFAHNWSHSKKANFIRGA